MCTKICQVLVALVYVDGQTDGHDEASSVFTLLFSERATNSMTAPFRSVS